MTMTQQDYEDRKARVDDGSATDEDHRYVRQYERDGYSVGRKDGDRPSAGNSTERSSDETRKPLEKNETGDPSSARTTVNPSKTDRSGSSTAASTAGSGKVDPSTKK